MAVDRLGAWLAVVTAVLLVGATGCVAAARVAPPDAAARATAGDGGIDMASPLTVEFASYGAGIDHVALARVDAYLARDPRVSRVERAHWGREGEIILSIWTRRPRDVATLLRDLRLLMPRSPRGPVHGRSLSGARWSVPTGI